MATRLIRAQVASLVPKSQAAAFWLSIFRVSNFIVFWLPSSLKLIVYLLSVVGVDACQTARFLQTLTNAIDVLAPVNSLDSNIPTIDGLIAELEEQLNLDESLELSLTSKAFADLTGSDDDFSDFHLELDLTWCVAFVIVESTSRMSHSFLT